MQIAIPMMPQQGQNKVTTTLSDVISNYSNNIETGGNDVNNMKSGHANNCSSGNIQRKQLWYILGFVSVLAVAAIVVVAVLVVGGSGGRLTHQQQQLSEIAKSISSQKYLKNSASPQYMAKQMLCTNTRLC